MCIRDSFVSAAGIVLEVGGVLQHGAVVAREYGKPCVVGIDGATALFQDGEMIEMDGSNGLIRRIRSAGEIPSVRRWEGGCDQSPGSPAGQMEKVRAGVG